MGTQITTVSKSVPTGFKYNVSVWFGVNPSPIPAAGEAIFLYYDNGEGGADFSGMVISRTNADGYAMSDFLNTVNGQPISIFTASGTYLIMLTSVVNTGYFSTYVLFGAMSYVGIDATTLNGTTCYFNFETSQNVPTYNGYSMAGNLNGTTIPVGTNFIGIGSSTSNTTETNRSVPVTLSQGALQNVYVRTAGTMTGSMALSLMVNGNALPPVYTIPAGSAAGIYTFIFFVLVTNGSNISIRAVQSNATSSGILTFGWIAR